MVINVMYWSIVASYELRTMNELNGYEGSLEIDDVIQSLERFGLFVLSFMISKGSLSRETRCVTSSPFSEIVVTSNKCLIERFLFFASG